MDDLQSRVAALERRLEQIESSRPARAEAPFQVVDAAGNVLLEIADGRHGPALRLFGAVGRPLVDLCVMSDGGGLLLRSQAGEIIAGLGCTPQGGFLDIKSDAGQQAVIVAAHADCGHVFAFDEQGNVTFRTHRRTESGEN